MGRCSMSGYMFCCWDFRAIAAVLAAIGIYGVMAYSVAERTREIGIRMALGAGAGDIFRLVVLHALILLSIGLTLGLAGSLALTRYLKSALYEVFGDRSFNFHCRLAVIGPGGGACVF